MRILHFLVGRCDPDSPNGVQKTVYYLSKRQAEMEHHVAIFSLTQKNPLPVCGVEVRTFTPGFTRFTLPSALTKAIEEMKPEIVHLHSVFVPQNVALARWLRRKNIPYVVTPNGGLAPAGLQRKKLVKLAFKNFCERSYWKRAVFVHAVSQEERAYLQLYGIRPPIIMAPNGLDPAELPDPLSLDHSYLGRLYPHTAGKRVFLFLGRLDPVHKGLDLLLKAYSHASESLQGVVLIIAGPDWRGHRPKLERLANELGLTNQVIFAGPKYGKEKFDLLAGCDVFAHTSRWEGLPFAVLEALAVGKPLLITTAVGFRDFLHKHPVGLAVEPSVEVIAKAFRTFASLPREKLQSMGVEARDAVRREFSWTRTAATLCEAYEEYVRSPIDTTIGVPAC